MLGGVNSQAESSVSPVKLAQEMAASGRIEAAAAQRAVDAKTIRLRALRLAKEEADREAKAEPSAERQKLAH